MTIIATFWAAVRPACLKEGIVEDHANREKVAKFVAIQQHDERSPVSNSRPVAGRVPVSEAGDGQDRIYYLLSDTPAKAGGSPHLERLTERGIEVLLLTDRIDPWLVDALSEYDGKVLTDVAREDLSLPEGDGEITQDAINEAHKPLLKKVRQTLKDRVDAVNVSRRLVDSPACVVSATDDLSPSLRRMLEASGQDLPETKPILEINIEHPLVARLSTEADDSRFRALSNIVLDHALLAEGAQLENPSEYVSRMNALLLELDSGERAG